MDTLFQKRCGLRRRKRWMVLALVMGFGWCFVEPIEAQRTGGYRGGRGGYGRANQADQNAADALEQIEATTAAILTNYLARSTPLQTNDIQEIQNLLNEKKKFAGKFPKERKVYLYMLESLLSHYYGDREMALARAQRAYRDDPKNPDLSDLIIVLSLCYENYEMAKDAFDKREEAGSGPRPLWRGEGRASWSSSSITRSGAR